MVLNMKENFHQSELIVLSVEYPVELGCGGGDRVARGRA